MKKVLTIFGTRPEAIKLAPLIHVLDKAVGCEHNVLLTGQHDELLTEVLKIFDIKCQKNLQVMKNVNSLGDLYGLITKQAFSFIADNKPDLVIVHGDTATTAAAAIAAYLNQVPVAHVEAGLRTNNLLSPWPEEGNRLIVSKLANLHFAPTAIAKRNLLNEGIPNEHIFQTGNTVIDAVLWAREIIEADVSIKQKIAKTLNFLAPNKKIILMTGHRRENFGEGFRNTFKTIKTIVNERSDVQVVYPVHLNPNVRAQVNDILASSPDIHLIEPMEYLSFVYLMAHCFVLVTDSGGIQEEAPSFGKPILVTRDTTERPEAIEAGVATLVGNDGKRLKQALLNLLDDPNAYDQVALAKNPFGDGKASDRIVSVCLDYLNNGVSRDA